MAAPTQSQEGQLHQAAQSRLARGSSFHLQMPASPIQGSSGAGNAVGSPSAPAPLGLPASPSGGALSSSYSSGGRFGGLVQGFRRARGQSTTRPNDSNNNGPPSPPVSTAFPALAASTSLNELGTASPYFDGDHHGNQQAGAGASNNGNSTPGGTASSLTGRGFMRRGFGRKNTAGFLGSGGGQRTPTGEAPPPLLRSRSSSQPSLRLSHPNSGSAAQIANTPYSANALPGQAPSFFPAQPSPSALGADESDRLAASTATAPVTTSAPAPVVAPLAPAPAPVASTSAAAPPTNSSSGSQHIRLVPHLESTRSLTFDPVSRDVQPTIPLRIGRFTDRNPNVPVSSLDKNRVAFKSKVVSRTHAEIWYDAAPPPNAVGGAAGAAGWFIRDLKSSSGTFLNHIRLSGPGMESRPFPLRDGDILQLGVDYQGGTEEIYRCVKMRVELNRGWQRGVNSFNSSALAQIRAFGNVAEASTSAGASDPKDKKKKSKKGKKDKNAQAAESVAAAKPAAQASGVTDCCICLFSVTVYQALFIAPCSHIFHFKCIRPLLVQHHPGFSCPLCRTFADLEADVEQDDVSEPVAQESSSSGEDEDDDAQSEEVVLDLEAEAADARVAQLDAGNLDTLRPGKRLPSLSSGTTGRLAESPRASLDGARNAASIAGGPSTPGAGRPSSSSFHRDVSLQRVASPAASLSGAAAGASSPGGGFHPPSAGDFEADIRRSSIFVQGADGMASAIPITGRSRPGSVYEADMSDSNIVLGAAAAGTPERERERSNRARSVKSLRMSTNSMHSLRQAAESSRVPTHAAQGREERDRASSPALAAAVDSNPTSVSMTHPARVGSIISQYHDFPNSDEDGDMILDDDAVAGGDISPPGTARLPLLDLNGGPATTRDAEAEPLSAAGTSPQSLFTAPMSAGTSQSTEGLTVGAGTSASTVPLAEQASALKTESEQAGTTPPGEGGPDAKGKGKLSNYSVQIESEEVAATLPGGLETMNAPPAEARFFSVTKETKAGPGDSALALEDTVRTQEA